MAGQHLDQRVAPVFVGLVQGVYDDQVALAPAIDHALQRGCQQVVEEFGGVLAVEIGDFGQGQQPFAVVGQTGGKLEGEAADHLRRVAVVGLVPFDELGGDDFVASEVGELRGKGALADTGVAGDPEEAGGRRPEIGGRRTEVRCGAPGFDGVEEPLAADEALAEKKGDAGVGGDRLEMTRERFDLAREAAAFVALHHADDFGEFGLIPAFP